MAKDSEKKGRRATTVNEAPGKVPAIPDLERQMIAGRQLLLAQVAATEAELEALGANGEPDIVDEGQEETRSRLLTRLDEHDRAEIDAIDRALARIASGDYGRCRSCGAPIPWARLAAIPWAEECVACAKQRETPVG